MEITLQMLIIVCPLVFLAGLIDSIAGGGGLISLPAYLLAGLPAHMAIGTNKLSSSMGSFISTFRFYRKRYIDIPVALSGVLCALIGSAIGSSLSLLVQEEVIKSLLIPVLPIVAFYVLRKKSLGTQIELPRNRIYIITMISSFIVGAYDGFYGPGTGTFLILLYNGWAKLDIKIAAGNAKAVNLASNIGSLVVFLMNGKVLFLLGIPAAICSILGSYVGSGMVFKRGTKIVRPVILIVLTILFVKTIMEF